MSEAGGARVWQCGVAARWLPRTLGGAVLVAAMLLVTGVAPDPRVPYLRPARALAVVAAGALALWIVRKGGEVRTRVALGPEGVVFRSGARELVLRYDEIDAVRYEAPMGDSRSWLPAATLVDRRGRPWRLCALLAHGELLVRELVETTGRADLASWVEAHRVVERMARSGMRVRFGYAAAGVLPLAALLHALGGRSVAW